MTKHPGKDPRGYLLLHLHAHMPFVRSPQHENYLEEHWLYESMTEVYLPLLMVLEGLVRDGVEFRLSMDLTPTLVSMWGDELLRGRYQRRLESLIELAEKETIRHRHHTAFLEIARFYRERFERIRDYFVKGCGSDLTAAFRRLQDSGFVEIIPSAATHGFLPLLRHEPSSARAQVRVAVDAYRQWFGREPQGMWLPECGYYPGLDELLAEAGLRFFFLESHGVLQGSTRARYGVHAPVVCPSGVAAFGRDPECSKQVWSRNEGFPCDPDYREYYRDIGFDLPLDYVGPYIGPDEIRIRTGIRYHRITGRTENKAPYVRAWAMQKAAEHAGLFLEWRQRQVGWLAGRMDRRPLVVAPYDAELFGHWWFEGPEWLNFLLRKLAFDQDQVVAVTPSEYLAEYPEAQVMVPAASTWGEKGGSEVWLNVDNDWIYPRLHRAAARMARLACRQRDAQGLKRRLLNQAGRELLLAQASDWPFILHAKTSTKFAEERIEEHLGNVNLLLSALEEGGDKAGPFEERLHAIEAKNNLFPNLQFEVFEERLPRPAFAVPENPRHVAFLSAEAVPYVKVGGLADVVGALPAALAELGVRVTVVLPAYSQVDRERHVVRLLKNGLQVRLDSRAIPFSVLECKALAPGVRVLLIDEAGYFGRKGVYVDPDTSKEYADTAERFTFFTKAGLEALRVLGEPVDVLHSHDHQTALASVYLKMNYRKDPVLGLAASVLTLHNFGYQGSYGPEVLPVAGFGRDQFYPGSPFEYYGQVNFMKIGIHFADKINTVSGRYAREICEVEEMGGSMGDLLRARQRDFSGILNGIDVDEWNPATDQFLPQPFQAGDPEGKRQAKRALLEKVGIDRRRLDEPLVGMISRLVDQKGFDLVVAGFEGLLALGVNFVVLGTGLKKYEDFFREAVQSYPGRVAVLLTFDNALAHLIEAGADIFLMPSLYEPCGLNQMYSLRYGTVPVVRETGGLADTVTDDDAAPGSGVGFSFLPYKTKALLDAMERALRAFRDPARWHGIRRRGLAADYSWIASATKYVNLYRSALASRS